MYEKQMELFEDGGKVDEVSGNDIPLGSTAKEVRDDQPAMLSEGEMVVPADVVRYFGVEYFMNLRDQAKMGYKKMEAMGQFGTEEGQTLPDDTIFNAGGPPFTIEDIEVVEDYEENEDEEPVKAADGALIEDDATITGDQFTNVGSKVAFTGQQAQDLIGVDNFRYLKSLMPKNVLDSASDAELEAAENYSNNIETNVGVTDTGGTSGAGGGGEGPVGTGGPSGGGSTGRSVSAPGTGDIFTMMNNPTAANIQGLKNFGELKDTTAGKAFLSLMGGVVSAGINPGQYAPVVGMVQRGVSMLEPALFGTNNIGKGLAELRDIPLMQANMASRAVRSFEYQTANMTPEQLSNFNVAMEALEVGDLNDIDITAPGTVVGVTDRGETVVGRGGKYGAMYNRAGEIVGDKFKVVDPNTIKEAKKKGSSIIDGMKNAADPNYSPSKVDPGAAIGWGGPTSAAEAFGITSPVSDNFGLPDDDDIEEDNKPDYGGFTGAESVLGGGDADPGGMTGAGGAGAGGPSTGSSLEGYSDTGGFDEGGGGDGAGDGGGGGDAASDTGADGPDGGVGGPGDFKRGGFVQKRKYKKKKKRRGLAGR